MTSDNLHSLLALLCKDEAASCVRTAENGNGMQAWQAFFEGKKTLRNPMTDTNQLLDLHGKLERSKG